LCELTSTHPAEYPVFIVVQHRLSPFQCFRFPSPNTLGRSTVETKPGSRKTTELIIPIQPAFQNGTQHLAKAALSQKTLPQIQQIAADKNKRGREFSRIHTNQPRFSNWVI
jgi:hypothetical protein